MRGYEANVGLSVLVQTRLRIPMRGYEKAEAIADALPKLVTNPHAGL